MNLVSRMLHATPVAQPSPGFVQRFDSRLAYRQEQRRQGMIWILLGIGVIALVILALPSLIALLSLTSRMVLPHEVITYVNGLFNWAYIVLSALADAGWVLVRHFIATPVGIACLGSISLAGILIITWTRSLVGRMSAQNTK